MIDINIIRSMQRPELQQVSISTPSKSKRIVPGPYDVICARGKQAYNHEGNRNFRQLIQQTTEKYSKVESKLERSMIVTDVVDAIRARGKGFLRKSREGEWVECTDVMCREKVGQHFRDALGSRYKSSSKSKLRIKHESIPRMVNNLNDIIFSSEAVKDITESLLMDIVFLDDSNDVDFYDKVFAANMNLLDTFKRETSLVERFQRQFNIDSSRKTRGDRRPAKPLDGTKIPGMGLRHYHFPRTGSEQTGGTYGSNFFDLR